MDEAVEYILKDLCVELGFCIPRSEAEKLKSLKRLEANEFASLVLTAEGMVPEYEKQWVRKISSRFEEYFGQSEVSNSEFRSAN